MNHDITFCWHKECNARECARHISHAPQETPFSVSKFECPYLPLVHFDENVKIEELNGKLIRAVYQKQDGSLVEFLPVVRCKDCKHYVIDCLCGNYCDYHTNNACDDDGYCDGSCHVKDNDFCSYGERITDG